MTDAEFFVSFRGDTSRFAVLSRFFDRLAAEKARYGIGPLDEETLEGIVRDPTWIDLLDAESIERLTRNGGWTLESLVWSILNGEYHLVELAFEGQSGRLVYDPAAYPFGGTDPLTALIKTFGLTVTGDSFWDGFYGRKEGIVEPPD